MKLKEFQKLFFIAVAVILVAGCATQPYEYSYDPPGFWMGLVHGFCIVFSLVGSIFMDIRVYEFPNSGGWYDFGYVIGAFLFLGAGSAGANS